MRKNFLVFGSPHIEEPEVNEVVDTLRSGWLSTGPKVARFEEMFRSYMGTRHAIALNSCTAGLHLSLIVLGVKEGDEVITSPMTFAATANAIIHAGAHPVFVDIDRKTMNMAPEQIEANITEHTRAIVPVHFAGRPCEMDKIMEIAKKYNLRVIGDGAHAIEAIYRGKKIGGIGDLVSFSFYVTKNVVTGEGGMVTTNNDTWAENMQIYGLHGMSRGAWRRYSEQGHNHYQVIFPGFKYNMMDIQASLGLHQLLRVEKNLRRREKIWQMYDEAFKELPVFIPIPPEKETRHARHLYTLLLDTERVRVNRDDFQKLLKQERIGTGIHFLSLHLHPYYARRYGYKRGDFPQAEFISDRTVSLPLSAKLMDEDVEDVIRAVKRILRKYGTKRRNRVCISAPMNR